MMFPDNEELTIRYQNKSHDELLEIMRQSRNYTDNAMSIAKPEFAIRNPDKKTIEEYLEKRAVELQEQEKADDTGTSRELALLFSIWI